MASSETKTWTVFTEGLDEIFTTSWDCTSLTGTLELGGCILTSGKLFDLMNDLSLAEVLVERVTVVSSWGHIFPGQSSKESQVWKATIAEGDHLLEMELDSCEHQVRQFTGMDCEPWHAARQSYCSPCNDLEVPSMYRFRLLDGYYMHI